MKGVTIYDVAQRAGVSISTVSLALNRPDKVSEPTRQKVLDAVDALGFVPKATAVIKARKGVGRVGVVAPFTSYTSYSVRLGGVLKELDATSSDVLVFDRESAASSTAPLLESLPMSRRVDGLIIMGLPLHASAAARLRELSMPVVLIDTPPVEGFSAVVADDAHGGRMLGDHLRSRGHTRIAYLGEAQVSQDYVSPGQLRIRGIRDALADEGELIHIELPALEPRVVADAVTRLLAGADAPTAIVAHFDELAAQVLATARELDLRVGDELAVTGYDDGLLAHALGLTTVRQPFEESGRIAARLLVDQLAGRAISRQTVALGLELVVRQSS